MSEQAKREQRIADLRELVDFLADHPDLPIGNPPGEHCLPSTTDDEARMAELRRIADILGVGITHNEKRTQFIAARLFGTQAYRAFLVTQAAMDEYVENQLWLAERRKAVES